MTGNSKDKDCSTGSCPVDNKSQQQGKLVKSIDLPLQGNPYPPKDIIQDVSPSSLELGVRSIRTTLQPYLSPICRAYQKTSDVLSIGAAHTQSTIQSLGEHQGSVYKAVVAAGAGAVGLALARRKGILKKILYGSTAFGFTLAACYPIEAKEKGELAWFIAKNKLPVLVGQQYQNLFPKSTTTAETSSNTETKK